jgi:hypothetical protein
MNGTRLATSSNSPTISENTLIPAILKFHTMTQGRPRRVGFDHRCGLNYGTRNSARQLPAVPEYRQVAHQHLMRLRARRWRGAALDNLHAKVLAMRAHLYG